MTINYLRVLIILTTCLISSRMDIAATRIAELGQQCVMRAHRSSSPLTIGDYGMALRSMRAFLLDSHQ